MKMKDSKTLSIFEIAMFEQVLTELYNVGKVLIYRNHKTAKDIDKIKKDRKTTDKLA